VISKFNRRRLCILAEKNEAIHLLQTDQEAISQIQLMTTMLTVA
jgi:hypothetical protein